MNKPDSEDARTSRRAKEYVVRPKRPTAASSVAPARSSSELEELRRLLFAEEQRRLAELEAREPTVEAKHVSRVLPDAVLLRGADDERLPNALAPTIEAGIETSVRRNPKVLADAIFPVIGPAIRKSIQAALATAVEGFNTTLEHSLSIESLRWRWEARRTGKPFSEVVLLKSLVYRVEEVFLIHRETSLLLAKTVAPGVHARDADMVSSMLAALHDFVGDSFARKGEERDELQQVTVAGARLFVEQGPQALLVAVVGGTPPSSFRSVLQEALETVQLERGEDLARFDGDDAPFLAAVPVLETCLEEQKRERKPSPLVKLALPVLATALAVALVFWLVASNRRASTWAEARRLLREEPGYLVTTAEERGGGYLVRGLRDPLARTPEAVLANVRIDPEELELVFEPFAALDPALVRARAEAALAPPPGVDLTLDGETIVALGSAPAAWIRAARVAAPALAGVQRFDDSALTDVDLERAEAFASALDGRRLRFAPGAGTLDAADAELAGLLADVRALDEAAAAAGRIAVVGVRGDAAPGEPGAPEADALAARRAAWLAARLREAGHSATLFEWIPAPADEAGAGAPEARLAVRLLAGPAEPGR